MSDVPDADLPRLNPSMLRDPGAACPRRIALAHAGRRGDTQSDARWGVSDAIGERARLAQLEFGPPDAAAFEGVSFPTDEQARVYRHAVSWYITHFGDRPGQVVDLGDTQWGRDRPDLGIRLTSRTPLVVECEGAHELRLLRFADTAPKGDLLEDAEVRIDIARVAGDIVEGVPRIVVSDLVRGGDPMMAEVSVPEVTDMLDAWIVTSLEEIRAVADSDTVRSGAECSWCSYVAGCPAHVR